MERRKIMPKIKKLTILTGSGASYSARNIFPFNPPLGSKLYESLECSYPAEMSWFSDKVGKKNINNFEGKMNELIEWGKIHGKPTTLISTSKEFSVISIHKIMCEYFLKFELPIIPKIKNDNEYSELINLINNSKFDCIYSTLNYDCLLECAALDLNMKVNYQPHLELDSFNILKLHGSCNFFVAGITGTENSVMNNFDGSLIISLEPPQIVLPLDKARITLKNKPLGSIMALYAIGKPTITDMGILEPIQESWRERILESDLILIIGVRPYLEDSHIWDSIIRTNAKIGYIGDEDDFEKLRGLGLTNEPDHITNKFMDSIDSIKKWLRS